MNFLNKLLLATIFLVIFSVDINAQFLKIEMRAAGLTCSMCSNAIYKQLETIQGVDSVEIDLNTNTFIAYLDKENNLNPQVFREKVEKAGFFIGIFIVTAMPSIVEQGNYVLLNDKFKNSPIIKFQVLDKGYVTEKEYKKLSKAYKEIPTFADGNEDNYHIKMMKQ